MTASNHVVTGALIGAVIVNPVVALPIAFGAHFALDAVPHFGFKPGMDVQKFTVYLAADTGFAAAVLVSIAMLGPNHWPVIAASGIACASPDLMWMERWVRELLGKKPKPMGAIRRFHARIQWAERQAWWAVGIEIVWLMTMLTLLAMQTAPK